MRVREWSSRQKQENRHMKQYMENGGRRQVCLEINLELESRRWEHKTLGHLSHPSTVTNQGQTTGSPVKLLQGTSSALFRSQHLHSSTQPPRGTDTLFWSLWALHTRDAQRDTKAKLSDVNNKFIHLKNCTVAICEPYPV